MYLLLQLSVLLLRVDEVEDNVERTSQDQGKEQSKSSQVRVPLGTTRSYEPCVKTQRL